MTSEAGNAQFTCADSCDVKNTIAPSVEIFIRENDIHQNEIQQSMQYNRNAVFPKISLPELFRGKFRASPNDAEVSAAPT